MTTPPLALGTAARAPQMSDWRLIPSAVAAWTCALIATGVSIPPPVVVLVVISFVLGASAALWSRQRTRRPQPRHALTPGGSIRLAFALVLMSAVSALITGSAARIAVAQSPLIEAASKNLLISLDLRVRDDPAPFASSFTAGVRRIPCDVISMRQGQTLYDERAPIRVFVIGSGWEDIARGDIVAVRGTIDTSFHAELPWAGTLRADDPVLVERPGGWRALVRTTRSRLVDVVAPLDAQGRALVPGMAIGDDRELEDDLADAMRVASLTHLTAVSGSHMAILIGSVSLLVPATKRWRGVAIIGTLIVIVALVGPQASVLRAASTVSFGVLALMTGREGQAKTALSAVVIATVVVDPWSARDFGFALSVIATFAVISPARATIRWSREHIRTDSLTGRALDRIIVATAVPFYCQLLCSPILMLMNAQASPYAVLANVIASPAIAPATILALAATLLAPWAPGAAYVLASCASAFTAWIAGTARIVAELPGADIAAPGVVRGVVLIATGVLVAVRVAAHTVRRGDNPHEDGESGQRGGTEAIT